MEKKTTIDDFEILEALGKGVYSTVYKVRRLSDYCIYALKKVQLGRLNDKEKLNALNEVRILASIEHPNIIEYKEAFIDEPSSNL
jgi:NIMA (never in mitosis gene a)-related kinase